MSVRGPASFICAPWQLLCPRLFLNSEPKARKEPRLRAAQGRALSQSIMGSMSTAVTPLLVLDSLDGSHKPHVYHSQFRIKGLTNMNINTKGLLLGKEGILQAYELADFQHRAKTWDSGHERSILYIQRAKNVSQRVAKRKLCTIDACVAGPQ